MENRKAGAVDRARRGRPRSPEADRRLLDAAAAVIAAVGYDGLTIEGVADRAGVAKTTLYRRWSSKPELVAATMGALTVDTVIPDTGSLRGDLVVLVRELIVRLTETPFGPCLRALQAAVAERPELGSGVADGVISDRRAGADVIIDRAIARGEVPPGADREFVFDLVIGACLQRYMVTRRPLTAEVADRLVDTVLVGYPNLAAPAELRYGTS